MQLPSTPFSQSWTAPAALPSLGHGTFVSASSGLSDCISFLPPLLNPFDADPTTISASSLASPPGRSNYSGRRPSQPNPQANFTSRNLPHRFQPLFSYPSPIDDQLFPSPKGMQEGSQSRQPAPMSQVVMDDTEWALLAHSANSVKAEEKSMKRTKRRTDTSASEGPTPSTVLSRDEKLRKHRQVEVNRRKLMNESFSELATICGCPSLKKHAVLKFASDLIVKQRTQIERLESLLASSRSFSSTAPSGRAFQGDIHEIDISAASRNHPPSLAVAVSAIPSDNLPLWDSPQPFSSSTLSSISSSTWPTNIKNPSLLPPAGSALNLDSSSSTTFPSINIPSHILSQLSSSSAQLSRGVFKDSGLAMDLVTVQGTFVDCNGRFAQLLGYSKSELMDGRTTFFRLTHPDSLGATAHMLSALLTGGPNTVQTVIKKYIRKDGSTILLRLTCWQDFGHGRVGGDEPKYIHAIAQIS
jgi:PAS domain S-box-containing protein